MTSKKMRTVQVNERGQIVIPEDVRIDLVIKKWTTLVMIQKEDEIILRKESAVLDAIENESTFWNAISLASLNRSWSKEDQIWDKLAKKN